MGVNKYSGTFPMASFNIKKQLQKKCDLKNENAQLFLQVHT